MANIIEGGYINSVNDQRNPRTTNHCTSDASALQHRSWSLRISRLSELSLFCVVAWILSDTELLPQFLFILTVQEENTRHSWNSVSFHRGKRGRKADQAME